jgi:hypothetical protein
LALSRLRLRDGRREARDKVRVKREEGRKRREAGTWEYGVSSKQVKTKR